LSRNFSEKKASNLFCLYSRSNLMRHGEHIEARLMMNDFSLAECLLCVVSMSQAKDRVNGMNLRLWLGEFPFAKRSMDGMYERGRFKGSE